MPYANQGLIFESDLFPLDFDKFLVAEVTGTESLSSLFEFVIELRSPLPDPLSAEIDLDLAAMVRHEARLRILPNAAAEGLSIDTWHQIAGVVKEFEQLEESSPGWATFRAVLVPKVSLAAKTTRSRLFAPASIDALIEPILTGATLTADDLSLQLSKLPTSDATADRGIYPERASLVQYEESDWNFLARHLEHEGIYFYFENDGQSGEKAVFADSTSNYATPAIAATYNPTSAGSGNSAAEDVRGFGCLTKPQPTKVIVREYNWLTTSTLTYEEAVDANGSGEAVIFNENFLNADQGNELAAIRAEAIKCGANVYRGASNARSYRPGKTIQLASHYRDDFNATYVLTQVTHTAKQDLSIDGTNVTIRTCSYDNTFEAIPSATVWRPARNTPRPLIRGLMTGTIVSNSSDTRYSVLDDNGCYLVTMKFDTNATPVKRLVRMSQPSAGPSSGLHFPLNPGVEVMIAHIDGDPDRPIIVGAVPNPDNESPTNADNVSQNSIRTRTGNMLSLDDDASASGFFRMDSSRSRVSDQRRRGIRDPLSSFTSWAAAQASGSGNAEAPRSPDAVNENTTAASAAEPAPRQATSQAPESGQGTAATSGAPPSLRRAWKAFFGGDAMQELAAKGPYRPESGDGLSENAPWGGMSISEIAATGVTNSHLDESNIVKLLNWVARDHTDSIDSPSSGGALTGKVEDLIKNKAQNFEGSAAGSTVSVSIGDEFIYSLGDKFEYADGSNSVTVGTGGYSRTETLAEGTTEEVTYGKQTIKSENHGTQMVRSKNHTRLNEHTFQYGRHEAFSFFLGGKGSLDIQISAHTVNELNAGIHNANALNVLGFFESSIYAALKAELEVGIYMTKLTIANSDEFVLSRTEGILNESSVFLNDMQAALKTSAASLAADEAALSEKSAALDRKIAALEDRRAFITGGEAGVQATNATIDRQVAALSDKKAALQDNIAALSASHTAATNISTAGFHSKQ